MITVETTGMFQGLLRVEMKMLNMFFKLQADCSETFPQRHKHLHEFLLGGGAAGVSVLNLVS